MREHLRIAVAGDFDSERPSHIATREALHHTAAKILGGELDVTWIGTPALETRFAGQHLGDYDGIWGAPGAPESSQGIINAIHFARANGVPYVGT